MSKRRAALKAALARAGVKDVFRGVLDHGGDRGQMLQELQAQRKAVYEISGVANDPGIEAISEGQMRGSEWDLILSCHVLEHLTFPGEFVSDLASLGCRGTIYYIEVPDEAVPRCRFNSTDLQHRWLEWLIKHPNTFKLFDLLSTGIRARLGVALPLMFFPLREHLTFFTVSGLKSLLAKKGLSVITGEVLETGHIGIVAVKR